MHARVCGCRINELFQSSARDCDNTTHNTKVISTQRPLRATVVRGCLLRVAHQLRMSPHPPRSTTVKDSHHRRPTGMAPSSKRKRNDVESEEDGTASVDDADATLEFGWEEQAAHTGGRQRKQAAKKKHKPGTFGTCWKPGTSPPHSASLTHRGDGAVHPRPARHPPQGLPATHPHPAQGHAPHPARRRRCWHGSHRVGQDRCLCHSPGAPVRHSSSSKGRSALTQHPQAGCTRACLCNPSSDPQPNP